ncbi:MAG: type I restriction-modification system subunit M N-terminal domain-containing protein, partial [Acidimicrobiales bacterium]|nr:type I restriction-modification system subunit M N-terminal domain-containing protein [Acidimicrobiales bacterium]
MAAENLSAFIWSIADLLRDNYKKSNYGRIILPFTVLRRIDCILETMQGPKVEKTLVKDRAHKES